MTRSLQGLLSVTCCLVLAVVGGVSTAPLANAVTWPPPVAVSQAGSDAAETQVAVAPDGTTTAVWIRYDGAIYRLQAATRPPNGSWSSPVDVSAAGVTASRPQVAVAANGEATVVWLSNESNIYLVKVSQRPAGGSWAAPTTLGTAKSSLDYSSLPSLVVSPAGVATVLWHEAASQGQPRVATRTNGAWGTPVSLGAVEVADAGRLAVAPDGSVTAVWVRGTGSSTFVTAASRPAALGGTWTPPVTLSAAGLSVYEVDVATGPNGTTTAVWRRFKQADSSYSIQAATLSPTGIWGTTSDVSAAGANVQNPQVTAGPDGVVTVVWGNNDVNGSRIGAALRSAAGAWSAPFLLSSVTAGTFDSLPDVTSGPDGSTVAAWQRVESGKYKIHAVTRAPLEVAWSAPAVLSPEAGVRVNAAVGGDGTVAIGWWGQDASMVARAQVVVVDDAFPPPVVVPDTSAISGKKTITKAKAKYSFTSTPAGATFECRVDKKFKKYVGVSKKKAKKQVPWKACSSPYVVKAKKLKNGKHKLYVRAVLKGVVDPTPSVKKITVQ